MIFVDPRDGAAKQDVSGEMVSNIIKIGIPAQKERIQYSDACFEGWGPKGRTLFGVERKTIPDMLACINDGRYNSQRQGMRKMFAKSWLLVEGLWKSNEDGFLMYGWQNGDKLSWGYVRHKDSYVLYSKLYRYLISVAHSGVIVTYSKDLWQTCMNICEVYQYHNEKKWHEHKSMMEMQTLNIPDMRGDIPLVREWAARINDIGVIKSARAEQVFKTPIKLATADELEWLRIEGVGVATAQRIVRQIRGRQ